MPMRPEEVSMKVANLRRKSRVFGTDNPEYVQLILQVVGAIADGTCTDPKEACRALVEI